MSDQHMNLEAKHSDAGTSQAVSRGLSRRGLMRSGLKAVPVVVALQSNTVLATGANCVSASVFASLNQDKTAFLSAGRGNPIRSNCKRVRVWKDEPHSLKSKRFLGTYTMFSHLPDTWYRGKTVQQILNLNETTTRAGGKLARLVAAAWLTASTTDTKISALSVEQCRLIWAYQGNWTSSDGHTWSLSETMAFLQKYYG